MTPIKAVVVSSAVGQIEVLRFASSLFVVFPSPLNLPLKFPLCVCRHRHEVLCGNRCTTKDKDEIIKRPLVRENETDVSFPCNFRILSVVTVAFFLLRTVKGYVDNKRGVIEMIYINSWSCFRVTLSGATIIVFRFGRL